MFGLSWGQIAIIVLVGVFVLGPERIPTAVTWVLTNLRKLRSMAAGAQAELRKEIGPELDELRRQVADLQSLKEIQELRDLRELHPKRLIGKNILGDEFSGGITGFLGLNQPIGGAADAGTAADGGSTGATGGSSSGSSSSGGNNSGTDNSARQRFGCGPAQRCGRRHAGRQYRAERLWRPGRHLRQRGAERPCQQRCTRGVGRPGPGCWADPAAPAAVDDEAGGAQGGRRRPPPRRGPGVGCGGAPAVRPGRDLAVTI